MTSTEFCYWLQGMLEIGKPESLSKEQIEMIKRHLDLVFTKVTGSPSMIRPSPHAPSPLPTGVPPGWVQPSIPDPIQSLPYLERFPNGMPRVTC